MWSSGPMHAIVVAGFAVAFVLWTGAFVFVVANRLLYDRRRRRLREIVRALNDPSVAELAPVDRTEAIRRVLSRRPRREVYRLVASPDFPDWFSEICATYCLEHFGIDQMRRDAAAGKRRARWRRISALIALGHIRSADAHSLLEAASRDDDLEVAAAAARVLFHLGDRDAAVILVAALRRAVVPSSRIATYLDRFPISIADLLHPLLTDPRPQTRYWAVSLLDRYPDLPLLVPDVQALVDDPDASVRKAALSTLTVIGGSITVDAALPALTDSVSYVRSAAVRAIGRRAEEETNDERRIALASAIMPLLADLDWDVRRAVKESLERMGHQVWRVVAEQLDSPDRFARNGAAEVLQNLGVLDWALRIAGDGVGLRAELQGMLARAFREGGTAMIGAVRERTGHDGLVEAASALPGVRVIGEAPW